MASNWRSLQVRKYDRIIAAVRTGSRKKAVIHRYDVDQRRDLLSATADRRFVRAIFGILPNERYIDWDNPTLPQIFSNPSMEWNARGAMCSFPSSMTACAHGTSPNDDRAADLCTGASGKFTIPNEFTGMTLLKSWLIAIAGGDSVLAGPFDEQKYQHYSAQLWEYIRALQPYMWKGKTFPDGPATMHRMLANGEIDFSMSNNDGKLTTKFCRAFAGNSQVLCLHLRYYTEFTLPGADTKKQQPAGCHDGHQFSDQP